MTLLLFFWLSGGVKVSLTCIVDMDNTLILPFVTKIKGEFGLLAQMEY